MANDLTFTDQPVDVTEGGATDSYFLELDTDPGAATNVDIDISGATQLEVSLNGAAWFSSVSVSFTDADFNVPQEIFVRAINDQVIEGNHLSSISHVVNASSSSAVYTDGLVLSSAGANITDDDDTTVSISATDSSAAEAGADQGQFTVILANGKVAPAGGITIDFTVGGTATKSPGADFDYADPGSSVLIPAGASSAVIDVTGIVDDNIIEDGGETVEVTLALPANPSVTLGATTMATVTIADNDNATVSIVANDSSASEIGPDGGQFTVTLSSGVAPAGGIQIPFTVAGTATKSPDADFDYTAIGNMVTIPAGASSVVINVTGIIDDNIVEDGGETVEVTLAAPAIPSVTLGAPATATVTIGDNDATTVSIFATDASASESGANPGQYTVTLASGKVAPAGGIQVNFTLGGNAVASPGANFDFASPGASVSIAGGASSAVINIAGIVDDNIIEHGGETVIATITGTNNGSVAVGAPSSDSVLIADNDATTISIAANDPAADETGSDSGQFTLTLAGGKVANDAGINVTYSISGTAANGVDYGFLNGTAFIAGGSGTAIINVSGVVDDNIIEDGGETVISTITGTNNGSVTVGAPSSDSVLIADNDATTVSLAAVDPLASETGSDPGQFTVTLAGGKVANDFGIIINYSVGGTATPGADYGTLTGSVLIQPGMGTANIDVSLVADDRRVEGVESVLVGLTSSNNNSVTLDPVQANITATATISDNDLAQAVVALSGGSFEEDYLNLSRGVNLDLLTAGSGTIGLDRSITVRVGSSGTASNGAAVGSDYTFNNPTDLVYLPADGASFSQNVGVSTVDDLTFEGGESIVLSLSIQSDGTGGQASVGAAGTDTIIIEDDDTLTARRFDVETAAIYRLRRTGSNFDIRQNGLLVATEPLASFSVTTNGTAGDESFVVDFVGGNPVPSLGLSINGSTQASKDDLAITGGTATSLKYDFSTGENGNIDVDASIINFTEMEMSLKPIADNMTVQDRRFDFNVGAETITVAASALPGFHTKFGSGAGAAVDATNSSRLLTLNTGTGDDVVNLNSFGGTFNASLIVNAGAEVNDTISVNTSLALGSATAAGDLLVTSNHINLNAPVSITTWRHQLYQGNVSLLQTVNNLSTVAGGADASDGNINFTQTVDGATVAGHSLMLTAGDGNLTFGGDVGANVPTRKVVDVQVASAKIATVMTNVFVRQDVVAANVSQEVALAAGAMIDAQRNITAPTASGVAKFNLIGVGGNNEITAGNNLDLAAIEDSGAPLQLMLQASRHTKLQTVLLDGNTPADGDDPILAINVDMANSGGNLTLNDVAGLRAGIVQVNSQSSEAVDYNVTAKRGTASIAYKLVDNGAGANDSTLSVTSRGATPIAIQTLGSALNIELLAGDNINITNQVSILANGVLKIVGDENGGDSTGTTITISGSTGLIGGALGGSLEGMDDDDTIVTAPERFRGGNALSQLGKGGNDRFRLNYLTNFDGPGIATPYTIDGGAGTANIFDINSSTDSRSRKNQFAYAADGSGNNSNFLTNVADAGGFTNTAEANWTLKSLGQYVVRGTPGGLDQTLIVGTGDAANHVSVGDVDGDHPAGGNRFGVANSELIRVVGGAMTDTISVNVTAASQAKFVILEGLGSSTAGNGEVLQGAKAATNLIFGASNGTTLRGEEGVPSDGPIGLEPNRVQIYSGGFQTGDPNIRDFVFTDYFRRIDPATGQGLALGKLAGGDFRDIVQSGNSVIQAGGPNDRLGQDPNQAGSGTITAFFDGSHIDVISWLRARFPGITELGAITADASTFGSAEYMVKAFDHRFINNIVAPPPPPGGGGIGSPSFTVTPANSSIGATVVIAATGATGNGITYRWTITQPDGSTFPLTGQQNSFVARYVGMYKVDLTVANATDDSEVLPQQTASFAPVAGNIVTATVSGGLLTLTGNADVNDLSIELGPAGMNSVRVTGRNGTQVKFGATTYSSGTPVPTFLNVYRGISTSLLGGADRVTLTGTNFRDAVRINGGAGDDAYVISARNIQLILNDSSGNDVLNFSGMSAGINLDLSQSTGIRRSIGGGNTLGVTGIIETAVGTNFADLLVGNSAANVLSGLGGSDRIYGRGGPDHLNGGAGNDFLYGEQGIDLLYGGEGNDSISGGSEGDALLGEGGNDSLAGDDGNDLLIGGVGLDTQRGGLGDDILIGGTTQHDYYDLALLSLLQQWNTVNPTNVRANQLRSGQTSSTFDLKLSRTEDDLSADSLFGESSNDWFLARLTEPDQLKDLDTNRDIVDRS